MSQISEKALSEYYKAIKRCCPKSIRKRLLADLKDSVWDYIENNEGATIENVEKHFGTPEQFASEYTASLDSDEQKKLIKKSKLTVIITVSVAICLILSGLGLAFSLKDNSKHSVDYIIMKSETGEKVPITSDVNVKIIDENGNQTTNCVWFEKYEKKVAVVKGDKTYIHTDENGVPLWEFTLHATFQVEEKVSAVCTQSSFELNLLDPHCSKKFAEATKIDDMAKAEGIIRCDNNYKECHLVLTCDKYGNLS